MGANVERDPQGKVTNVAVDKTAFDALLGKVIATKPIVLRSKPEAQKKPKGSR